MPWLNDKIWPAEAKFVNESIYWGSSLAVLEMLQSGTTTFADMYDSMHEVARVVEESGVRANLSRGLIVFSDTEGKNIQKNVRLYENFHNQAEGRLKVWFAPHAPYTCPSAACASTVPMAASLSSSIKISPRCSAAPVMDKICVSRIQIFCAASEADWHRGSHRQYGTF